MNLGMQKLLKKPQILFFPECATQKVGFITVTGRVKPQLHGFLDDYAFLVWGLLELYEATFEIPYLKAALEFNEYLLIHFRDNEAGGFYITSDDAKISSSGKKIFMTAPSRQATR